MSYRKHLQSYVYGITLIFSVPMLVLLVHSVGPFFGFTYDKTPINEIGLLNISMFLLTLGFGAGLIFYVFQKIVICAVKLAGINPYKRNITRN